MWTQGNIYNLWDSVPLGPGLGTTGLAYVEWSLAMLNYHGFIGHDGKFHKTNVGTGTLKGHK